MLGVRQLWPGAGAHKATTPEEISVPECQDARQARYLPYPLNIRPLSV